MIVAGEGLIEEGFWPFADDAETPSAQRGRNMRGPRSMAVLLRVLSSRGVVPSQPNGIKRLGKTETERWYYAQVVDRTTGEDRGERWFRPDEFAVTGWDVRKVKP